MKFAGMRELMNLVSNYAATSRVAWLQQTLGYTNRDIDRECGHPVEITTQQYGQAFERGDLAKRVVSIYPEESWQSAPEIYETENETETEFEKRWQEVQEKHHILQLLQRADVLSGIGRFGIILLGIDDGLDLREPITGLDDRGENNSGEPRELIYLRAFDERLIDSVKLETNPTSPRFGQPIEYTVKFDSEWMNAGTTFTAPNTRNTTSMVVHWHRIIHLTDNRTNSEIFGEPRLKVVYNRLLDLKKIAGASPEMFWKGGFPGLFFGAPLETKDGRKVEVDIDSVKEEYAKYAEGLQRILIGEGGVNATPIPVQLADPTAHAEVQFTLIAAAMAIPKRILMGSERGELASSQDKVAWNERLNRRREDYLSPFVIRPMLGRLMNIGILPKVETVFIDWSDLNTPSEQEKAEVAAKKTDAMAKYVASGMDALMSPFHYWTLIQGMTDKEAEAIEKEAGGMDSLEEPEETEEE